MTYTHDAVIGIQNSMAYNSSEDFSSASSAPNGTPKSQLYNQYSELNRSFSDSDKPLKKRGALI